MNVSCVLSKKKHIIQILTVFNEKRQHLGFNYTQKKFKHLAYCFEHFGGVEISIFRDDEINHYVTKYLFTRE